MKKQRIKGLLLILGLKKYKTGLTFSSLFTNIMKLTLLLVLASCFLEVQPEPVTTLAILGGVAAVVAITSHTVNMSVKLWSSLTKNHCWPKEIDANAEFSKFQKVQKSTFLAKKINFSKKAQR